MRGAGWSFAVLPGVLGFLALGPLCVGIGAAGFQQTAKQSSEIVVRASERGSSAPASTEPPRVRAAREFLARRGLRLGQAPGHLASLPGLRSETWGTHTQTRTQELGQAMPEASGGPVWSALGPVGVNSLSYGLVTGRVSAIAVEPSDASGNHVFVGTTGGGLWQSQNAAASTPGSVQFLPLTDNLAVLSSAQEAGISIGAVTVQPGGTGVVLVGLGDPNDALDSYYGAGLLRSGDGGQTWTLIQQTMDLEDKLSGQDYSFLGEGFAGFAWSTTNSQLVVAAVSQAYEGAVVNAVQSAASYEGLYWSNDSGSSWHLARITDQDGEDVQGPLDGFVLPDGNAATSVVWNPVRQVFVAAVRYHGYYQSTDGMNWMQMPSYPNGQPGAGFTAANCPTEAGSVGVAGCPIFRGSLAVNPVTGDTFAWSVDAFNQDQGIWQDQCNLEGIGAGVNCATPSITFGTRLATTALESSDENGPATIENGDYNLTLAAVPTGTGAGGDTLVFAGDNDLWKCSLAAGCAWRNTTNSTTCMSAQVGEYQHGFAWDSGNPLLLYVGTDSGLWRSSDDVGETGSVCASTDASHWQNLNGSLGLLAEVGSLGESASSATTVLIGLGANGVAGIADAPATAGDWNEVLGGEGGPVAVDPTSNVNSWYANNGAGVSIFHCSSAAAGAGCSAAAFGTTPVIGESQVGNDGLTMPFPAEFRLDPMTPADVLIGTCRVWRGPASGSGWSASNAISPILDGSGGSVCNGNALIRSIAAGIVTVPAASAGEVIYVGMAGVLDGGGVAAGHLFSAKVSSTGTVGSWTDLSYSPVVNNEAAFNAFGEDVSGIYVDPHDATGQTVYVAVSGIASPSEPQQHLYGSTDGGAHWTSLRSNLPNAPANSVVVDSQDANTVYVATDVGVFVTRAIGSCGGATVGSGVSCWAPYGSGLPLAPVTTLAVTPTSAASQVLTAGTYGRGVWEIPSATAGAAVTTATVTPVSLTFAGQTVDTSSALQTVTLKTTGTTALTVSSVELTGSDAEDFTETDDCAGAVLADGTSCQLKVGFSPTATGSRLGSLTINANVAGGQLLVPLTGTGLAPGSLTLLPTSLSFGTQEVGTTSAVQTFNIQNVGGSPVSISSITVSAPFAKVTNTCGSTLAASTACAVTVDFAPKVAGAATGSITVTDSVGTQSAQLTGTGLLAPTDTLSTTSLSFASTVLGQTSPPLTVTISNNGGVPLTSIGTSVSSSAGSGDFKAVSDCGSQLAAGSSCGVTVTFSPSVASAETGTLVISDALRSQSVKLSGTGVKPPLISLSVTTLAFGNEQINVSSAAKTVTITNKGGSPLGQPSFSISGTGALNFSVGTTTCGASVAAGGACTVGVIFSPIAAGPTTATLTVATTSQGVASANVTLTGTGMLPPMLGISPAVLNLGTVVVASSSSAFTVQVTNTGQEPMTQPAFAVSGISGPSGAQVGDFALSAPTDITACTGTVNPGASCNIQVTFAPSVVGVESATLTVTASNAIPPTGTVSLTGTGSPPIVLESSVATVSFPPTAVGTITAPQTFSISNVGKQTANSLTLVSTGPYILSSTLTTCGSKLAGASSCTVGVSYAPTASGSQPGLLTATVSNLGVAPLTVGLDGSGVPVGGIMVSPTQMTFGSVVVDTASGVQSLIVTNSGQAALTGVTITANGDYSVLANTCPATLAAGASCSTDVQFTPPATGILGGTLTINTDSTGVTPAVVPLTGNGIPAGSMTVNPAVVNFGTVTVGLTSPAQTVTVSNAGATTLTGLAFQVAGDYSLAANGCGGSLASGANCTLTVQFSPTVPGTRIGSVTIQSTTSGFVPVLAGLTGTGLPTAQLVVDPTTLAFGSVEVGSNSTPLQLTVSNPGTGTLQGLSISTASPFSVGSGNCGTSLPAGGTCTAPVTFSPVVSGNQNGTVVLSSTSLGVPTVRVSASGTGLAPASLSFNPTSLTFSGTGIGTASAAQIVTVTNPGGEPLSGLTFAISGVAAGDFAMSSSNCTSVLTGGGNCSVSITFTPTVAGGRQASLTASSSTLGAGNAAITAFASLNGTGLTPAVLSITPGALTFPATLVGQVSGTQTATIENSGQAGITDLVLAVSAGFGLDPTKTTCTQVLNGGASCTAGVVFTPAAAGAATGALTASAVAPGTAGTSGSIGGSISASTALNGAGALPPGIGTTPATTVQFGTTGVGQAAQPVQLTVSNQGTSSSLTGVTLAIDATGETNGFGLSNNTCGATIAVAASCTVNITFVPTANGTLTGTLLLTSTNGGSPVSLQLVGVAFDFRFTVIGNNSASVAQGQTAYYTFAVTALGGAAPGSGGTFSFQCANLPANALCLFNPAQLSLPSAGVAGNIDLGISTGSATAERNKPEWRGKALLLCGALAVPLGWRRRKIHQQALALGLIFLGMVGCMCSCTGAGGSGSSSVQLHTGGSTPPSSYTVTVTASANGVVHSLPVTLVVN
ncbi:beta strand repeat-containing protein [Acidicapsa acidisoli]|uniref:beta strand repeat-containing protein n=1 Tax=Acidicapsa acidisoli TaxID=1615681 RepID=UPI0021DFD76E|nr:choice-of-anchor D domain-containing protein [Acidicapsa acidisoli]